MVQTQAFKRLEGTVFERAKVAELRCLVVGVGAVGSELARVLGQIGCGEVGLVDADRVEPTNAPHSVFFSSACFHGRLKVEAVAAQAGALFSGTVWTPYPCEIADLPMLECRRFHLVIAAPDSAQARMETAYLARRMRLPLVDAALMGKSWWRGRVSWFPASHEAACYLCGYGESRRAQLLRAAASTADGCSRQVPALELASTPVMSSVVAGLAVDVGVRELLQDKHLGSGQAYALDARLEGQGSLLATHRLTLSATCPWHGKMFGGALRRVQIEGFTLREALLSQGLAALELEWPMVVRARCLVCGRESERLERVARFRRGASCGECGSRRLLPVEVVTELHVDHALASRGPSDLGLARVWLGTVQEIAAPSYPSRTEIEAENDVAFLGK